MSHTPIIGIRYLSVEDVKRMYPAGADNIDKAAADLRAKTHREEAVFAFSDTAAIDPPMGHRPTALSANL